MDINLTGFLVALGAGLLIGIERELAAGTLVFVPLSDRRLPVDRLRLVARTGAGTRPTVEAFLEIVQRDLQKF